VFVLLLTLTGCGNSAKASLHETLNGSWENDIMTVTFDFDKGTYSGVALGQTFSTKLSLVSEEANLVVFKSNENKIVCQFQNNGSIMLTKEGGIPIILNRVNRDL
jgi:hypothetical protein